jgi:DNA polymerase-3 subunit epsilon
MIKESIPSLSKKLSEMVKRPNDFLVLERIPFTKKCRFWPLQLSDPTEDSLSIILLDIETTGLSLHDESIIELGMAKLIYSPLTKKIISILDVINLYQDPGKPIPKSICELTGITDDMVKGKSISNEVVKDWLSGDPIVVAHGARFDRPFFDKHFDIYNLTWACTISDINWNARGFKSNKLEYLLLSAGWFYDAHRAAIDCLALAWLLHTNAGSMNELLSKAYTKTILVRALGAPFIVKDRLRENGYFWDSGASGLQKHWWKEINMDCLPQEKVLLDSLYHRGSDKAYYDYRDVKSRFKVR